VLWKPNRSGDNADIETFFERRPKKGSAFEWLKNYLRREGGEASFQDIVEAGATAGHVVSTLQKARQRHKDEIGVREESLFQGSTLWFLQNF
jgi:hypothetical protein